MGGRAGESTPPPSCREREVNVYQSYCQLPCGHGVGNEGRGVYSPFLLALVPLHQVAMVELGWGGGVGLEVLGAEVKTVL